MGKLAARSTSGVPLGVSVNVLHVHFSALTYDFEILHADEQLAESHLEQGDGNNCVCWQKFTQYALITACMYQAAETLLLACHCCLANLSETLASQKAASQVIRHPLCKNCCKTCC